MAITTLVKLGPTVTARISASRMTGNDSVASVTRISDGVDAAPVVARDQAHRRAEGARHQHGDHARGQRDPRAPDDAREQVAAQPVGAEQVLPGAAVLPHGRLEAGRAATARAGRRGSEHQAGQEHDRGDEPAAMDGRSGIGAAETRSGRASAPRLTGMADARVDDRVEAVDAEVHRRHDGRGGQHHRLDDGKIARADALVGEPARSRATRRPSRPRWRW